MGNSNRLGPGGAAVRAVVERLRPEKERDVSVRRALLLALAEFDKDRLPPHEREALVPHLVEMYRDDPDPGIHGAVGWLLRQWQQQGRVQEIDQGLRTGKIQGNRRWYVNGQGQTMVIVPPGDFESRAGREARRVPIERRFALAAREVTMAEFLRFRKEHRSFARHLRAEDCPVYAVTWYDAAAYCNWLSEQEGIAEDQWCYLPNAKGEYAEGMMVAAGYLDRSGYRLPTEAEWEYACRAGSVTGWSMGEAEDLLGKYAWFMGSSAGRFQAVGSLRPNDLGLFDLHGNAQEWCQDPFATWEAMVGGKTVDVKDGKEYIVNDKGVHPLRGGSSHYSAGEVRSAYRPGNTPSSRILNYGFRPARTFR